MAVFLINICKFNGCGIKFDSLGELITHIENIHIDYDPQVIEQKEQSQPSCLPLSYVLRFITDAARKESPFINTNGNDIKRKLAIKHHSYSMSSSNRSNTPTGSEMDDEEMVVSESDNSNESWTTEEFSSEFIMRYGSRHSGTIGANGTNEKPFACPVPGCKKRYKNVNGIKYHSKNGHKKEGKIRKGFKCYCGKSYKTSQGLKNHSISAHNNASTETLNTCASSTMSSTSPSTSSSPTSLSHSRSISPSSTPGGNGSNSSNNNNNQSQLSPNSSPSTFGLLTLKSNNNVLTTTGNVVSPALMIPTSNKNANKMMKMFPDTRYENNNTKASPAQNTASNINNNNNNNINNNNNNNNSNNNNHNHNNNNNNNNNNNHNGPNNLNDNNGVKINLPSLVNLGILTPATSPKQQQTQPNSQQTASPMQSLSNGQTVGGGSDNNNSALLPLTPVSPILNESVNFTNNANSNINATTNTAAISDSNLITENT